MRKIIVSNYVSLDGFFAGPKGEIDWFVWDKETAEYSIQQLNSIDTILFGRTTYDLMAGYWPTPEAVKNDPIIAEKMNDLPKVVFSTKLEKVEWKNSRLVKGNIIDSTLKLKKRPGKDMVIFGSGSIVSQFTQHGLIDEYRIFVNPIVLGSGKFQFKDLNERLKLKLLSTKTFQCGVVLLYYETKR